MLALPCMFTETLMSFSYLRCKGGHVLHVVRPNGIALCGHEPKDSPGSTMRRAGWWGKGGHKLAIRDCAPCVARALKIKRANEQRDFMRRAH